MKLEQLLMVTLAGACALVVSGARLHAAEEGMGGSALLAKLHDGGYVIYQRHAPTDTTHSDGEPVDINNCATQRPLSDAGRALASKIGAAFRAAHVSLDRVISSPYCRAVETAALEFPMLTRITSDALSYSLALSKERAESAAIEVKAMLATAPQAGTSTLIVGHTSNLQEAAGIWPKKEGGAIVFRPDRHGGFDLIGTIDPTDFEKALN